MADHRRHHVAVQIAAMLDKAPTFSTQEYCIYRVPPALYKLNPDAYTPKIVSIGPFHHGNTTLIKMEDLKQLYCKEFIERSEANLDDLFTHVQEMEPKVRRCYSENIELSVEEFVKVILVDCCFILELLWRRYKRLGQSKPWLLADIAWDLILLENQLPFFVFEKLYSLSFASCLNHNQQSPSFMQLVASSWFALDSVGWYPLKTEGENLPSTGSIRHFTDLYRYYLLQLSSYKLPARGEESLDLLYSATELNEAGVKFRVNEVKCFIDLQLSRHCLRIPPFTLMDNTEQVLRNLMVFEQYHYPDKSYIIDYIILLDFLINTDKDVDILVKNGIIRNWIGDNNEAAKLFNDLCKNILVTGGNNNHIDICKTLNAYYEHPCHSKMATLRRDYCNTPWRTVASVAAIFLLILTVIQTVCSIQQAVK